VFHDAGRVLVEHPERGHCGDLKSGRLRREMQAPVPLREQFARPGAFVVAAELVTSRGLITADSSKKVLELAQQLAADPRIDVLSITDNPGGHAMLAPDTLGTDLISRGQEVIIHLSCKDWNRNALESRGWKLGSEGFHNVLALSGDYPVTGHRGLAAPVFDIDSVGLLSLYDEMNNGLPDERRPPTRLDRTSFFLGCVVTNHKRHEREVMPQYFKLRKKVAAGARFVINQIGWNARKDDELLRWIRREQLPVSVLANVYLLSRTAARAFHAGRIPGVVVTDELLALAERHGASPDKGRAFFVDLAAKHFAVARGLGFDGVYLGGHMPAETFGDITDRSAIYASDWRAAAAEIHFPFPDEFYFFEGDGDTGLSSDAVNAAYLESKRRRKTDLRVPLKYRFSRALHGAVFEEDAPLFPAGRAFYTAAEKSRTVSKLAHAAEQAAKVTLFDCRDCGDCSLPDIAYVCPESQCAKNQRNGPCGGTRDSLCEVYDTECIWSQAYERLKAYGEEEAMLDGPTIVKDNALIRTSAWANLFLGRDHHARLREAREADEPGGGPAEAEPPPMSPRPS
jgi:methylenetetrahydrofolate reductase (NADPH)